MFYDEDPPFTERTRLMAYQPAVLVREIERLRTERKRVHDAIDFALDILMHCTVPGPGCDDALARDEAITQLHGAMEISGASQTRVGHDSPDR